MKVVLSLVLVFIGITLAVVFTPQVESAYAQGIILDFGDYDIYYLGIDDEDENAIDSVNKLCDYYSMSITWNGNQISKISKEYIDYPESGSTATWKLYINEKDTIGWKLFDGSAEKLHIGDYSAVCWGLCEKDEEPTPGVDAMGICFYGYGQSYRIVSLAPSCTETIAASGAGNIIVGADEFSNYPLYIKQAMESGAIVSVGGYTNPSYEVIAQLNPDIVIGVADQSTHRSVIEKMRAHGVHCLATYTGDSIKTIMDNTYMIGAAMNYQLKSTQTMQQIEDALEILDAELSSGLSHRSDVMISLSTSKSPWVAGGNTYASDVISRALCNNIYSSETGWAMVNSETVPSRDPEYIIVVSSDYGNTDEDYNNMISSLSAEWRNTTAFKQGNIFLLTGGATDLASRPSTRIAQFTELMCRMIQPEIFNDINLPHHIGDDYKDYLTITKELGFDT
ncbi:iron ABC transporter substrate-binding protein [methanogenic archaeon mixed culture ISO4-G1]|nr:iron ABC transporter substrate-binding protein [methanogenic archaeon mixed culture ISO4-G1]